MRLWQPSDGYRYNTDSILLYDFASRKKLKGSVLDVGCGCGIVGLLLARDFNLALTGVDIQEEMVRFARKNSEENNVKARFVASDFKLFDEAEKFDVIISNPPFYNPKTTVSENASLRMARYASALSLSDFLRRCGRFLKSNGDLFFCYDAAETTSVLNLARDFKWHIKTILFAHRDRFSGARLIFVRAKKSPVKSCEILPPIFTRENGETALMTREINKRADTRCAN